MPKGYEALLPFLRADAALRETSSSRLKVLWFAGAGLPQHVCDELKEWRTAAASDILFLTGFGSTETAPYALVRTWDARPGNVGLPAPALDVKLVPIARASSRRGCKGPTSRPAIGVSRS